MAALYCDITLVNIIDISMTVFTTLICVPFFFFYFVWHEKIHPRLAPGESLLFYAGLIRIFNNQTPANPGSKPNFQMIITSFHTTLNRGVFTLQNC